MERLPGCAPELNPTEPVWGNVKSLELANLCADTIGEVAAIAEDGLDRTSSHAALCFGFSIMLACSYDSRPPVPTRDSL